MAKIIRFNFKGINTLHKPPIQFNHMSWSNRCIVFCGVGFGSGLLPKAPGTFGSAFALLFIPLWLNLGFINSIYAIIFMSLIGIYICGQTAKVMGVHDDGRIVWDEFAGQSITLLPLIYFGQMSVFSALIGFCCFACLMYGSHGPFASLTAKSTADLALCSMTLLRGFGQRSVFLYTSIFLWLSASL